MRHIMKSEIMKNKIVTLIGCVALMAGPAAAEVTARQIVEQEKLVKGPDGRDQVARVPAENVIPGEEVIYTLDFENNGNEAAENVVLVMPVPPAVAYMEGSVTGDGTNVTFSADGGTTYVARGRLTVRENGAARAARSDEITHVRWVLAELGANQSGNVSFRGVLK